MQISLEAGNYPAKGDSMDPTTRNARTLSTAHFDPDAFFDGWDSTRTPPDGNDLRSSIIRAFDLPSDDHYVYRAIASITLGDVQRAIGCGAQHGLHAWYLDEDGKPVD